MTIEFAYLADRPEFVPVVARWWFNEWERNTPGSSFATAIQRLGSALGRFALPIQRLALAGSTVLGCAELNRFDDLEPPSPYWLSRLYVAPRLRGRGYGTLLAVEMSRLAKLLGVAELNLRTECPSGGLFTRLGWAPAGIGHMEPTGLLMVKQLLPPPSSRRALLSRSSVLVASAHRSQRGRSSDGR